VAPRAGFEPATNRLTAILGRELDVKLSMVFVGLGDDSEVLMLLEEHGLISEEEQYEIYERYWGKDTSEAILLPFVRRAFFEFFKTNAIVS
jgi:hypothetical protein